MTDEQRDLIDEARRAWREGGSRAIRTWWRELSWDDRDAATTEIYRFVDTVRFATTPTSPDGPTRDPGQNAEPSLSEERRSRPRTPPEPAHTDAAAHDEPATKPLTTGKASASHARDAEMLELQRSGVPLREIGSRFGVSRQAAKAAVTRATKREQVDATG